MRFAHLIYLDESATERRTPDEVRASVAAHAPYIAMLKRGGRYHGSEALAATALARTLRRVNDRPLVTQGPFAEAREQLGGLYVVEADDLDAAVALAAENPALRTVATAIEVRPITASIDGRATGEPRFVLAYLGAVELRDAPSLVGAATLGTASILVRPDGTRTPGTPSITGYAIVTAPDIDAAAALATGDPVEVRAARTGVPR